jgi:Zn-dependent peptidase ImmA (M78 family)/DNA-binding XRE family transcriptional regulator
MVTENESRIIPQQLKQARESLGLSIDDVASQLGFNGIELFKWELGEQEPPIEMLWKLAGLYQRSTDYFLRPTSRLPEELHFRLTNQNIIDKLPRQTRETIVRFDELCRNEVELEKLLNQTVKPKIERITSDITPDGLALEERRRLQLADKPIRDLRKLLSKLGVHIFLLPIVEKELSGLSWWHSEYGPCILVNAYDEPRGRRAFTMAHEYCHLVRSNPPSICDLKLDIPEERYANTFASHFLIPANDVIIQFQQFVGMSGTLPDYKQLGILAGRYSVSLEALSWRLESLELIPKGSTERYIVEWSSKPSHYRGAKGPRWKRQLGEKYFSLALNAHTKGQISLGKLARYLGVDVRTASNISQEQEKASKKRS